MGERDQLEQTIAALESQRAVLGDAVVDASIAALRRQVAALEKTDDKLTPELRGERKLVTVVFADVSGFTAMSEAMDPEVVRDLVNACFECLVPVVRKYEGMVDKFIGDNIMALFGAPVAHEDDPIRALRAALEMVGALDAFNAGHGTDLGLHFGINTGHVIAGGLGTQDRQEYSVMGDAVNLASRLEDASERGEILVGPDTYRLTAPLFEFEALDPIQVEGKVDPVQAYRLLCAKAVRGKVRGIEGLVSPLVGRDDETRALREALERLCAGLGGIVTIVGEAGLGKSRLVAEVRRDVTGAFRRRHASDCELPLGWVEGRCLSYGGSIAYLLWLDVLRGLLGMTQDTTPLAVRDALRERVRVLCPDHVDDVLPYLAQVMSLPLDKEAEAKLRGLDGESLQYLTFRAVEMLIERAAQERPLVVVCEDLHWSDPTSIALLERTLALTDRAPLLFVCVFRPETEHGCWQIRETAARRYRHRHTDVWLDPLTTDESALLVGNLLHIEDLPQALRGKVLAHAEGNPFYVEEIIRSLIDSETIVQDEGTGRWQATREVDDVALPDTLHGVLMARIDRLQEETKRILQLASVIGRVFFYRVLAEIAMKERELDARLLALQREQLIRERARVPELEYVFKHELTREAAYNGLLKRERRAYHRQAAEALERLFPDRVEERLGLLAHHWERAGETEKAIAYLRRAGEQARKQFANVEAVEYFGRALDLTPEGDLRTRFALLLAREGVYDVQGEREAQEQDLVALDALAKALDDDSGRTQVALRWARYAEAIADYPASIAAAQTAIRLGQAVQDIRGQVEGRLLWGQALRNQGDSEAAWSQIGRALDLARSARELDASDRSLRRLEADALLAAGEASFALGNYARGRTYYEQALDAYREVGDRRGESESLVDLGVAFEYMGDYAQAKAHVERALAIAREIGDRRRELFALVNLGAQNIHLGAMTKARACSEQALHLSRQIGDRSSETYLLLRLAGFFADQGDYASAGAYVEQALCISRETGDPRREGWALDALGWFFCEQGDYAQARDYYEQSLRIFREIGNREGEGQVLSAFGLLYHCLGDNQAALGYINQALLIEQELDDPPLRGAYLVLSGHILTGLGLVTEAARAYEQALALREQLGHPDIAMEALAGLADTLLAQGDLDQAQSRIEEVLSYLEARPALDGRPRLFGMWVYVVCYRVLRANKDPRAREILTAAHRLLHEHASKIGDEETRRSFLENVLYHREIVEEFKRTQERGEW